MGKGDKKSKRGKIILGTYGVRRKKKATKIEIIPAAKAKAPVIEEKVKPVKAAVKAAKPKAAPKSAAKATAKVTEKVTAKSTEKATEKAPKTAAKTTKSAAKKKE